jgi:signal transduction histidine kinase
LDRECCWNQESISQEDCPEIDAGDEGLLVSRNRRILEKCCDCDRFKQGLARFRDSGEQMALPFSLLYDDYQHQKSQIQSLVSFLDSKTLEVRFLHELGSVLQSSVDLEEVLSVALTAITAGKGFGMNRAFLFMTDKERDHLQGYLAIGPRNYEEASQTWSEIASNDMDLQTLAQNFRKNKLSAERAKFHDVLERLSVPLSNTENILIKVMDGKNPILIQNAFNDPNVPAEFAQILGVDTFLLMPLISRNRRVGIIIADNCITHRQITDEDMRSLETFTFPVAFAIERASLYDRLQVELSRVTEAGNKLKEQQELIVKMEKMALVGRITSSVAHSIRNPLMIIGGFARSMLKNTPESDPKRDFIESIVSEARQLEGVLDEILNYSDSLYPTRDFWDANYLVEGVIRDTSDAQQVSDCTCGFAAGHDLPSAYIDFKQVSYCMRTILQSVMVGCGETHSVIAISTFLEGDKIALRIEDRCRIMSPEDLEGMLTPFSSTEDLGNGLGLALCKTMLEKQGIPFIAELLPENGLLCTIKLPTQKEEQS